MYIGGQPSDDGDACLCFERVEKSVPPSMPFTLTWQENKKNTKKEFDDE